MLAIPEEISSCAKLRSPAADPSGTPSSKIWLPEAPSSTPLPPLSSSALRSSFHVVSNCAAVRTWPNSYKRANFSRIFRLRTNARAEARVSMAMLRERLAAPKVLLRRTYYSTGDPAEETSLEWLYCTYFNNIFLQNKRLGSLGSRNVRKPPLLELA